MQAGLALVDDPLLLEHRAPAGHPERTERLISARQAAFTEPIALSRAVLPAQDASPEALARVHSPTYIERLGQSAGKSGYFDPDTYYSPQSVAAALRAAGGSVGLMDSLTSSAAEYGLALLRPPGHHARAASAMGFCLLNNVAVAAAHARAGGVERVAIVDWDVHHGNGTQEMFYDDPNVLYVSLHQFPYYPGTGAADEVGTGDGAGRTVNVPFSAGASDAAYAAAFDRLLCPILEQFDPGLLLISAGFDAHRRDPLASMTLSADGFAVMLERMLAVLPDRGRHKVALLLEGGYDLVGISESLAACLQVLDGKSTTLDRAIPIAPTHEHELTRAMAIQKRYWKLG